MSLFSKLGQTRYYLKPNIAFAAQRICQKCGIHTIDYQAKCDMCCKSSVKMFGAGTCADEQKSARPIRVLGGFGSTI